MNKMTTKLTGKPVPPRRPAICVFCGSSHGANPVYTETARTFGTQMVQAGFDLVFGGGGVGLMGEVALAVSKAGGGVMGIIPGFLRHLEPPLKVNSQIVITETMAERKEKMFAASDAFAILPGGIGTLDEFSEVLTAAQLRQLAKPIVVVNVNDYYAPLFDLLAHYVGEGFAGAGIMDLFKMVPSVEDALKFLVEERDKAAVKQSA